MQNFDIIIVGGGPAGQMAAIAASQAGAKTLIIEKNNRLGKKLSITGGGRCNITNATFDNREMLENYKEARGFLFSSFDQFNVQSTFDFFNSRGMDFIVEDRNRAFPATQKAEDVCKLLQKEINQNSNIEVLLNTEFKSFITDNGQITGIKTDNGTFTAKNYIIATGGKAYPETGSTGEMFDYIKKLGHTVKEPDPNLSPLKVEEAWAKNLSGLSLDDAQIRFIQNGKTKLKKNGRILFTHFGISGPTIINSAYEVKELLKAGSLTAEIDLFPNLNHKELDQKILSLITEFKGKNLKNTFKQLIPNKLLEELLSLPGAPSPLTSTAELTAESRQFFVSNLKSLTITITGTMGYEWSIVADGGIQINELEPKSFQSKLHPNLYLIGDIVNINRPSGGFSLQLCWTMGHVAGTHAASAL